MNASNTAIALITEGMMKGQIKTYIEERCAQAGIKIDFHCITGDCSKFGTLFRNYPNVIAWNCRSSHDWLMNQGQNVLVCDNALLAQGSGIFMDNGGYYSKSNLCRQKTWENRHDVDLAAHTQYHFKWEPLAGGKPDGPLLVCLQNKDDAHIRYEFPLGNGHADRVGRSLELFHEHLPDVETIIRPHPRFKEKWEEHKAGYQLRPDWKVDWEGKFWEVLPKCRALVTVNSTCASEAATLGIPIATLGTGEFMGSGTTLECAHHPERLADILDWEPRQGAGRRYGEAILGRHWLPYKAPIKHGGEFDLWLQRAINAKGKTLQSATKPIQSRRMNPDTASLEELTKQVTDLTAKNKELMGKVESLDPPELDDKDKALMQCIADSDDGVLLPELPSKTNLHPQRVRLIIQRLEKRGFVASHGGGHDPFRIKLGDAGRAWLVSKDLI
jgi:hypothetical protein